MPILSYNEKDFLLDGKPYTIISGAIHYFRVVPEYWEDRLLKLKACGFNTVETYTCWNLHERREGEFDFSGILDIERFISIAESLDLNVIIRPGPYICAEWEFGGLPSWLLKYENLTLRCDDELFYEKVTPYYRELFARIRPHLSTNGGRVFMMQVENEYGSYGDDKIYLQKTKKIFEENGIDCLLFTSDGTNPSMLSGGTLPELLAVANFGSAPADKLAKLHAFKPNQPLMCGEFWCGWFSHWYEEGHTHKPEAIAAMLDEFFEANGSFNFYMFHGGTNFGFTNGANHMGGTYQPTITSYDYCAPLSEAGDMTATYDAVKKSIEKNTGVKAPDIEVHDTEKAAYGEVTLGESANLLDNLTSISTPVRTVAPATMEQLDQNFGYILYSSVINGPIEEQELEFTQLHDRAHIFLDGKLVGLRERSRRRDSVQFPLGMGESVRIDILVENMGRVNYGPKLLDRKGIVGGIRIGSRFHFGWDNYSLPMEDLSGLVWAPATPAEVPTFYKGSLNIKGAPADTFVKLSGFEKGFITINGFNLGRFYNSAGPQKTLYVPAPILREGENEIIVFESDRCVEPKIEFLDTPEIL
ncbi:MAG: beta-galactosidase [Clostridia bacterium]|nr:beta-galactosidase [Clostridia bacterium]